MAARSNSVGATEHGRESRSSPAKAGAGTSEGADGIESAWGEVRTYDPPRRLTLTWKINGDWQLDDADAHEIEVTFTPVGDGDPRHARP